MELFVVTLAITFTFWLDFLNIFQIEFHYADKQARDIFKQKVFHGPVYMSRRNVPRVV